MPDERNLPGFDDPQDDKREVDDHNRETMAHEVNHETDDDVPFKLPRLEEVETQAKKPPAKSNSALTMPHFREPGVSDPKMTLPGTGGLDPNPDMAQWQNQPQQQRPAASNPPRRPAEPTLRNQRPVAAPPPPAYAAQPQQNQYQRPAARPQAGGQGAYGQYVPQPPQQQAASLPKSRRRRRILGVRPGCLYMMIGLFLTLCGGTTLLSVTAAAIFIPRIEAEWTDQIERVDDYRAFESTFIYDREGDLLFEAFGEGRRVTVPYEEFPSELILATVAIEDDSFFQNIGIDVGATLVAFLQYVGADAGEQTPGGSTITQQLVRNVLFDFEKRAERSVQRKAEEIMLAILLTNRKSKEDILAMYLNEIYYGNLAYGAQVAAQTFFGKDVSDLTLGEAALLAGLPQAPANLDPLNPDPEVQNAVYARWQIVLNEMVEEGFITDEERNATLRQGLSFATPTTSLNAPHFTVYAQGEFERLMESLGYTPDEILRGGFRVYTTVDQGINNLALEAARNQVATLSGNNVSNAAVVVLKPLTGEILGMVGSIDYYSDRIDGRVNVTTAFRQPGSTMKPFTYAAAMERGMTPADVIWDTRTDIGIAGQPMYSPVNYDRRFHGPMTLRRALANSYNIPAVQTLRLIGVEYLLQFMQRFGVASLGDDASRYGLSLTLGGGEVALLELTNAYAVFANQGSYVPSTSILCIVDNDDTIIYQYENGCPAQANGRYDSSTVDRTGFGRQVLDPRLAFIITDVMSDNAARTPAMGANSPLRTDGIATSVKTGTTNDVKDNWTVGYTRNIAVGVWVGNNDGQPMVNSSGLTGAAPIWNNVITGVYNRPDLRETLRVGGQFLPDKPNPPSGMSLRQVCDVRSITDPSTNCPRQMSEWLLDGPVGIPDSNGNLQFVQNQTQPQNNPYLQEISPDVYRARVIRIPDGVAAGISFQTQPGDKVPPPPRYCRVTAEQAGLATNAQDLIFIAGPATSQGDIVEAERYAQQNNLAFLPTIDCWQDMLTGQFQSFGPAVVTAVITSPTSGSVLSNAQAITGTVQFDPGQADFYHFYIQGGQFAEWTPLGQPGRGSVINGQLEYLHVPSLQPGTYRLRLALVRGGDFIQQPYEVTFTVQ